MNTFFVGLKMYQTRRVLHLENAETGKAVCNAKGGRWASALTAPEFADATCPKCVDLYNTTNIQVR